MSYIVSIKRPISKADLLMAIDGDEQFAIVSDRYAERCLFQSGNMDWLAYNCSRSFDPFDMEMVIQAGSNHASGADQSSLFELRHGTAA